MVYPMVIEVMQESEDFRLGVDYVAVGVEPPATSDGDVVDEGSVFVVILADNRFGRVPVESCRFRGFIAAPVDSGDGCRVERATVLDPSRLII